MKKYIMKKYNLDWLSVFLASLIYFFTSPASLAQVFNGQAINATVTNNAFWKRNVDDNASGIYTLSNSVVSSGSSVTNMQREFNACSSYTGLPLNSVYNILPAWSNNDVGSSSNNLFQRSDAITFKFNATNGHKHTGAAGDAPQITNSGISSSAAIARSKIAAGTLGYVVINDPSTGLLSEEAQLSQARGGSGVNNAGTITWGSNNLSFTTSASTSVSLPTSGTLIRRTDLSASSPISYNNSTGDFSLGTVGIASGGTGQTTQTAAFDALSPLTTKGDTIVYSGTHNVRFAACSDGYQIQFDSSQTNGIKCVNPSSPSITLTDSHIFVGSASNVATDVAMSGDLAISNAGLTTIQSNVVSNSKIRQSAALSVVGNSTNATANVADISAGSDNQILRRSGTAIGFGSIDLSQSNAVGASLLGVSNAGTGQSSYTNGQLLIGNTTGNTLAKATLTAGTGISVTNGAGSITLAMSGPTTSAISASAIDWSTLGTIGGVYTKTLGANTTFTFSSQTAGQTIVVTLTNTASNWMVTWPGTVKWSGGTAPTQTIGAKTDVYTFIYDGTNTYGNAVQNF